MNEIQAAEAVATPTVPEEIATGIRGWPRPWLVVTGIAAVLFVLRFASAFVVPLLIGILISYALRPLVDLLVRLGLHRTIAAAVILATLVGAFGWIGYAIRQDVVGIINSLPDSARKLREKVRTASTASAPLKRMQEAAKELEKAAAEASGAKVAPASAASVPLTTSLVNWLIERSAGVLALLAQLFIMVMIAFFLLCAGDLYKRKFVRLAGTTLSEKKNTVAMLDEINSQIQLYMLTTVSCNALIGVLTGVAFAFLHVENAAFWGVVAGLLHFIPYLGTVLLFIASMTAAFLQFDSLWTAFVVGFTSLVVASLVGMVLMTIMQSRVSRVNTPVLFVAMFLFAWLWGPWGLILGPPLVAIAKVIFDHVESLEPLGDMMGEPPRRPPPVAAATEQ